jgi:hypothetical protein
MTAIQVARERSHLKLGTLCILRDSTTQKIAIKKFIATQDNISVTKTSFNCLFSFFFIYSCGFFFYLSDSRNRD